MSQYRPWSASSVSWWFSQGQYGAGAQKLQCCHQPQMTGVGVTVRTTEKVGTAQANGDTNVRTNRIDAARGSPGMLVDGARGASALRKAWGAGVASRPSTRRAKAVRRTPTPKARNSRSSAYVYTRPTSRGHGPQIAWTGASGGL